MQEKSHHVAPAPQGGWSVRKGGAERASKHFDTKGEALSWGKRLSKKQHSELVIHKRDGTIEQIVAPDSTSSRSRH